MTRSAADAASLLEVMAGSDPKIQPHSQSPSPLPTTH